MRNLSQRRPPSKEAEAIINDLSQGLPIRQLGGLVCRICRILPRADELLLQRTINDRSTPTLSEIIRMSILLDMEMQVWSNEVPGNYRYTCIEAPGCPSSPKASFGTRQNVPVHHYTSLSMAMMWNMYRSSRILLLHCLLQCLTRVQRTHASHQNPVFTTSIFDEAKENLQNLFHDICASVPYLVGDIDQEGHLQYARPGKAV